MIWFLFQGYYLMQQGGVISFSDSESFLVRIANIQDCEDIAQYIFCKKSELKLSTKKTLFELLHSFYKILLLLN